MVNAVDTVTRREDQCNEESSVVKVRAYSYRQVLPECLSSATSGVVSDVDALARTWADGERRRSTGQRGVATTLQGELRTSKLCGLTGRVLLGAVNALPRIYCV